MTPSITCCFISQPLLIKEAPSAGQVAVKVQALGGRCEFFPSHHVAAIAVQQQAPCFQNRGIDLPQIESLQQKDQIAKSTQNMREQKSFITK